MQVQLGNSLLTFQITLSSACFLSSFSMNSIGNSRSWCHLMMWLVMRLSAAAAKLLPWEQIAWWVCGFRRKWFHVSFHTAFQQDDLTFLHCIYCWLKVSFIEWLISFLPQVVFNLQGASLLQMGRHRSITKSILLFGTPWIYSSSIP